MVDLTAQDLWPLVSKLSYDEQVRLAKLVLAAAGRSPADDAARYRAHPPAPEEMSGDPEALAWEAEGWDSIDAPR